MRWPAVNAATTTPFPSSPGRWPSSSWSASRSRPSAATSRPRSRTCPTNRHRCQPCMTTNPASPAAGQVADNGLVVSGERLDRDDRRDPTVDGCADDRVAVRALFPCPVGRARLSAAGSPTSAALHADLGIGLRDARNSPPRPACCPIWRLPAAGPRPVPPSRSGRVIRLIPGWDTAIVQSSTLPVERVT